MRSSSSEVVGTGVTHPLRGYSVLQSLKSKFIASEVVGNIHHSEQGLRNGDKRAAKHEISLCVTGGIHPALRLLGLYKLRGYYRHVMHGGGQSRPLKDEIIPDSVSNSLIECHACSATNCLFSLWYFKLTCRYTGCEVIQA